MLNTIMAMHFGNFASLKTNILFCKPSNKMFLQLSIIARYNLCDSRGGVKNVFLCFVDRGIKFSRAL